MASTLCDPSVNDESKESTYGQILKSSALVGGSQVLNIAIGIVRTKAMAMLLGPAGFGLFGLYGSIANMAQTVAGMGINSSGVRQIAEAAGGRDTTRIAMTAAVLRRTSIVLGALGATLLAVLSRPISTLTFGNTQHTFAIALLSLAVYFNLLSAGQGALIQGTRRISDLAKMSVLGALFGALISIVIVYFMGSDGVVPSIVAAGLMTALTSWRYSRKLHRQAITMPFSRVSEEAAALLKLGFAFMASGLLTAGIAYGVRIIVLRHAGLEAMGLYQSAWMLGGLYVGFILQAMGADFYPRLTASVNDHAACNRMVNEQARVGLLLAGPGVIATLTLAPLVIGLFYTAKFGAAVGILRWISLGAMLQVITWPMGFIIVAKNRQSIFFWCEVTWALVSLLLAFVCVNAFGVNGAGIAFFGSYIFHACLIYPIVRRLSGFRWSVENYRTGALFLPLIAAVFMAFFVLTSVLATCVAVTALLIASIYSLRTLLTLVSITCLPRPLERVLTMLRGPVRAV